MAVGTIMPSPVFTGLDTDGNPLAGGKLYTYEAGTTTPATTYSDVGLTVANANPVVLNTAGRAAVFLTPGTAYKFLLKTSADVTVWTADTISSVPTSTASLDVTGTAGEALAERDVVYLADGTGGTTAGRWYRAAGSAAATSTTAKQLGVAVTALTTAQTGGVRLVGSISGYAGLAAGTLYYASATPGALTSAAPANARVVGVADSTTSLVLDVHSTAGPVTIGGAFAVAGTLGVTGAATVGGTLGVTGDATVGGTLGVTGAVTLTAGLTVAGAAVPLTGTIHMYGGVTAPTGYLACDGTAQSRSTYAALFAVMNPTLGTFTVTVAAPGVFTLNAHGMVAGDRVYLTTTGALPTGLAQNTAYYVTATSLTTNTFTLAATSGGATITTTGTQSGTHTLRRTPYGLGDGSTTFNVPDARGRTIIGVGTGSGLTARVAGATVGAETHALVEAELAAHTHTYSAVTTGSPKATDTGSGYDLITGFNASATTGTRGSGTAHNNMQPSLAVTYIIKT